MKETETNNILLREFKTDDAKEAFDNRAGIKKLQIYQILEFIQVLMKQRK